MLRQASEMSSTCSRSRLRFPPCISMASYFSSQMYETVLWKVSVPKSKSPVLLDDFYLLWPLETVINVTISHD